MVTLNNLELQSGWKQAANLGNTVPGQGPQAVYGITQGATFFISSPGPNGNGYMYREIPVDAGVQAATKFHYEFECMMHAPQNTYPQAIEFEFQRIIKGVVFNFALQLDFAGSKQFRHFNYAKKNWLTTGVACDYLSPEVWHKLALDGRLIEDNDSGKLLNLIEGFASDGVLHETYFAFDGFDTGKATVDQFTHAIQLDTNGQNPPPPFEVALRNMTLSYA